MQTFRNAFPLVAISLLVTRMAHCTEKPRQGACLLYCRDSLRYAAEQDLRRTSLVEQPGSVGTANHGKAGSSEHRILDGEQIAKELFRLGHLRTAFRFQPQFRFIRTYTSAAIQISLFHLQQ